MSEYCSVQHFLFVSHWITFLAILKKTLARPPLQGLSTRCTAYLGFHLNELGNILNAVQTRRDLIQLCNSEKIYCTAHSKAKKRHVHPKFLCCNIQPSILRRACVIHQHRLTEPVKLMNLLGLFLQFFSIIFYIYVSSLLTGLCCASLRCMPHVCGICWLSCWWAFKRLRYGNRHPGSEKKRDAEWSITE